DRQEGGVCDTQGQETSWENSGFVAEPVSPKRFLCSPRGSAHAPHISACPKKLNVLVKSGAEGVDLLVQQVAVGRVAVIGGNAVDRADQFGQFVDEQLSVALGQRVPPLVDLFGGRL